MLSKQRDKTIFSVNSPHSIVHKLLLSVAYNLRKTGDRRKMGKWLLKSVALQGICGHLAYL